MEMPASKHPLRNRGLRIIRPTEPLEATSCGPRPRKVSSLVRGYIRRRMLPVLQSIKNQQVDRILWNDHVSIQIPKNHPWNTRKCLQANTPCVKEDTGSLHKPNQKERLPLIGFLPFSFHTIEVSFNAWLMDSPHTPNTSQYPVRNL
jgi:hypothetical protein